MIRLPNSYKHMLKEYSHFFETYKILKADDPKKYPVTIAGYKGKEDAMNAINHSIKLYKEKFNK